MIIILVAVLALIGSRTWLGLQQSITAILARPSVDRARAGVSLATGLAVDAA